MHLALGQNTQRAVILVNNYRLLGRGDNGNGGVGRGQGNGEQIRLRRG